jgi:hypothetical protein
LIGREGVFRDVFLKDPCSGPTTRAWKWTSGCRMVYALQRHRLASVRSPSLFSSARYSDFRVGRRLDPPIVCATACLRGKPRCKSDPDNHIGSEACCTKGRCIASHWNQTSDLQLSLRPYPDCNVFKVPRNEPASAPLGRDTQLNNWTRCHNSISWIHLQTQKPERICVGGSVSEFGISSICPSLLTSKPSVNLQVLNQSLPWFRTPPRLNCGLPTPIEQRIAFFWSFLQIRTNLISTLVSKEVCSVPF